MTIVSTMRVSFSDIEGSMPLSGCDGFADERDIRFLVSTIRSNPLIRRMGPIRLVGFDLIFSLRWFVALLRSLVGFRRLRGARRETGLVLFFPPHRRVEKKLPWGCDLSHLHGWTRIRCGVRSIDLEREWEGGGTSIVWVGFAPSLAETIEVGVGRWTDDPRRTWARTMAMAMAMEGGGTHGGMDFEEERKRRIRINREKLASLGFPSEPKDHTRRNVSNPNVTRGACRDKRNQRRTNKHEGPTRRSEREKKAVDYREHHDDRPTKDNQEDEIQRQKRWNERVAMAMKVIDPETYEKAKRESKEKKRKGKTKDGQIQAKNRGPVDSGKGIRVQGGRVYDSKNGITCHWCRQKTVELHVTCTAPQCANGRMPISFCERCLRNRHGEDIQVAAASGKWVCPKCRGSCGEGCVICCNCGPCRKKYGLGPTFQLIAASRKAGFTNVHDFLVHQNTKEDAFTIAYRKVNFEWGRWLVESMAGNSDAETAEQEAEVEAEHKTEEYSGGEANPDAVPEETEKSQEGVTSSDTSIMEEGSDATQSHGGVEACALSQDGPEDEVDGPATSEAQGYERIKDPQVLPVEANAPNQTVMPAFMKSAKATRSHSKTKEEKSVNRVNARTRLNLGKRSEVSPGQDYTTQAMKRTRYRRDGSQPPEEISKECSAEPLWTPPIHSKLVQMQLPLRVDIPSCTNHDARPAGLASVPGSCNITMANQSQSTPKSVLVKAVDLPSQGTRIRYVFGGPQASGPSEGVIISKKRTKASFYKVRFEKEGVLMVKLTGENHGTQWVCA